jgi:hypothetical protein
MPKKMIPVFFMLLLFHGGLICFALAENSVPANTDPDPGVGIQSEKSSAAMTDIHDIKPTQEAGGDPDLLLYFLAGLVIAGLIGTLIYRLIRRRRRNKITTVTPILLPEETAKRLLDGLSAFETLSAREFYFQLSAILRGYIKDRFSINAPEMTTEEFLPWIKKIDIDRALGHDVRKLLSTADPIKFAGMKATGDQMGEDLLFVRKFVKDTTPNEIASAED